MDEKLKIWDIQFSFILLIIVIYIYILAIEMLRNLYQRNNRRNFAKNMTIHRTTTLRRKHPSRIALRSSRLTVNFTLPKTLRISRGTRQLCLPVMYAEAWQRNINIYICEDVADQRRVSDTPTTSVMELLMIRKGWKRLFYGCIIAPLLLTREKIFFEGKKNEHGAHGIHNGVHEANNQIPLAVAMLQWPMEKNWYEIELHKFGRVVREVKFQGNFFFFFNARKMGEHRACCD